MTFQEKSLGTDVDFLQRLQSGDNGAWSQLMDEQSESLYSYLCYRMPTAEHAQDVLQETLTAAIEAIKNFDGKVTLSTFIFSIARRKVADFYRYRREASALPATLTTAGPTNDAIVLQDALGALPAEYRDALLLRYHIGLSVSELAKSLGKSYKATESLLSRARKRLEEYMFTKDAQPKAAASNPRTARKSVSAPAMQPKVDRPAAIAAESQPMPKNSPAIEQYPGVKESLIPAIQLLHNQVDACQSGGKIKEAQIFKKYASKLARLIESPTPVDSARVVPNVPNRTGKIISLPKRPK